MSESQQGDAKRLGNAVVKLEESLKSFTEKQDEGKKKWSGQIVEIENKLVLHKDEQKKTNDEMTKTKDEITELKDELTKTKDALTKLEEAAKSLHDSAQEEK